MAAENGAEDSAERLRLAVKRIDKAAAKGVIHPNQAARRKSRLVRSVTAIQAGGRRAELNERRSSDLAARGLS